MATSPATFTALRATLAGAWTHRRWWLNDPDCVVDRAHGTRLSDGEVRAWASVVAVSDGMLDEAMDVLDERWDGSTMRISLASGRAHTGLLHVAVPGDWRHVATPTDPPGARADSGLLSVPFDLRGVSDVRLQFTVRGR